MAVYRVLTTFVDVRGGCRLYHAGDTWPAPGVTPDDKQAAELCGGEGRAALIAPAEPEKAPAAKQKAKAKPKKGA